jgi:hypothetical protein
MSPKASKRKVAAESDAEVSSHSDSEQTKKPAAKKSKAKEPVKPLDASLPHNTAFPKDLQPFPAKAEGSVRLSAWNVCGIKACDKKVSSPLFRRVVFRADWSHSPLLQGLRSYLEAEDADIVILTETKSVDPEIKELKDRYEVRRGRAPLPGAESMLLTPPLPTVPLLGHRPEEGIRRNRSSLQAQACQRRLRPPYEQGATSRLGWP